MNAPFAEQLAFIDTPRLPEAFEQRWRQLERAHIIPRAGIDAEFVNDVPGKTWITVIVDGRRWAAMHCRDMTQAAETIWRRTGRPS